MTEYYRKLDAVAQSRYLEKLKLLGLEEKDDPYKASNSCVTTLTDPGCWLSGYYHCLMTLTVLAITIVS